MLTIWAAMFVALIPCVWFVRPTTTTWPLVLVMVKRNQALLEILTELILYSKNPCASLVANAGRLRWRNVERTSAVPIAVVALA